MNVRNDSEFMDENQKIMPGEGYVVTVEGRPVAAYKDENGVLIKLSAICKHRGCTVGWNKKDKTWDCPCHGSRYRADGTVFHGPAKENLDRIA